LSTWGSSSGNGSGNEVSLNPRSWVRFLCYPPTLPRNGMNNRHVKSLKWEDPTQAYKKKIVSQFFYKSDEASFFSKKIDDININATNEKICTQFFYKSDEASFFSKKIDDININATHEKICTPDDININATHEKICTPLANILKIIVALQMPINQIVYAPHHMKHNNIKLLILL